MIRQISMAILQSNSMQDSYLNHFRHLKMSTEFLTKYFSSWRVKIELWTTDSTYVGYIFILFGYGLFIFHILAHLYLVIVGQISLDNPHVLVVGQRLTAFALFIQKQGKLGQVGHRGKLDTPT